MGSLLFFRQIRPIFHGRSFALYKFRTMTDARDVRGSLLPDEVRLTLSSKWLGYKSLYELPELINLLKGEMSLVELM